MVAQMMFATSERFDEATLIGELVGLLDPVTGRDQGLPGETRRHELARSGFRYGPRGHDGGWVGVGWAGIRVGPAKSEGVRNSSGLKAMIEQQAGLRRADE